LQYPRRIPVTGHRSRARRPRTRRHPPRPRPSPRRDRPADRSYAPIGYLDVRAGPGAASRTAQHSRHRPPGGEEGAPPRARDRSGPRRESA